jgi:hypothetical protein
MNADPHHQFRRRIDQLRDERDHHATNAERWHQEVLRLRSRIRVLENSLAIWRIRRARTK